MKNIYKNRFILLLLVLLFHFCSADENNVIDIRGLKKEISFPDDYGFHTNINEWIYFSGLVESKQGRVFGLMMTVFQYRELSGRFIYPTKVAIIDIEESNFYKSEDYNYTNYSPPENGYLSISTSSLTLHWSDINKISMSGIFFQKDINKISFELNMKTTKEALLHGEDGYITMGDRIASGYYSFTNLLPISGEIAINDKRFPVKSGRIWMDRQWGDWTSAGNKWDWYSLRFDDGASLMIFRFRDFEDKPSFGNWTYRDSRDDLFYGSDIEIVHKRKYNKYPLDWRVELPSLKAEFDITPIFDAQAFDKFWEGICSVSGRINNNTMNGEAFVELTGY